MKPDVACRNCTHQPRRVSSCVDWPFSAPSLALVSSYSLPGKWAVCLFLVDSPSSLWSLETRIFFFLSFVSCACCCRAGLRGWGWDALWVCVCLVCCCHDSFCCSGNLNRNRVRSLTCVVEAFYSSCLRLLMYIAKCHQAQVS